MNLLTFDIEEWYLNQQKGGRAEKYAEYDRYLEAILDKLDERGFKATFFCVGEMGSSFPEVIRRIQGRGHEIGCHSDRHLWLNKMSVSDCREDTRKAVDRLEQCTGTKILSYRAPAFSIGESNKWAFEVLAENGFERDASVFPAVRDFGGFSAFGQKTPCWVEYKGIRIKEFPVCTVKVMGRELAYSGGGYFRFFPLPFVMKEIRKSLYAMCYFHISDLIPESRRLMSRKDYEAYFMEPGTLKARTVRYFKSNIGKKTAFDRMIHLIDNVSFYSLQQADGVMDWSGMPVAEL